MRRAFLLAAGLLVASCGGSPQDQQADRLENAAAQSDPAAAEVLDNAADALRESDAANPQAEAQNALQAAGNAQTTVPTPNLQAEPHRAGDPVPPAKSD